MRRMYISLAVIAMGLVFASCSLIQTNEQPGGGDVSSSAKATSTSAPSTPDASVTPTEPNSSSQSPSPKYTPEPTPTVISPPAGPRPSNSPEPELHVGELTLFYVAIGDNGQSGEKVGCGDSLVMDTTGKVRYRSQLKASFDRLLANHERELGQSGLYNALWQSSLKYVKGFVRGDTVTVNLRGELRSGGTCDDPRIIGQLKRTASVAAGVGRARVRVRVNGTPIRELLSAR